MSRLGGVLLVVLGIGCAGAPPVARHDTYDRAYLNTRRLQDGCRDATQVHCCARIEEKLKRAIEQGAMQEGATQLELLALSCRRPDPELIARFRDQAPAHAAKDDAGGIALVYDVQLGEDDRLYWAGAFVDGNRALPGPLAPGPHRLGVEVHLLPMSGVGEGQLFRIHRSADVTVPADTRMSVVVTVRRTTMSDPQQAFSVSLTGRAEPKPSEPPKVAGPPPAHPPSIVKGHIVMGGAISPPSELTTGGRWAVLARVCTDREGRTQTVTPLIRMHPRDVAALVDWVIRQRHEPYRINGAPVPYCYPLRFEVRS